MIGQALLTLLALSGAAQGAKTTQFASLEALMTPLAERAGYRIDIPGWLAARPVVYYFGVDSPPMERLTGLAKNLFLDLKVDADNKTIKVSRSGLVNVPSIRARARQTLLKFRDFMAPMAQLSPVQLYAEMEKYQALGMTDGLSPALNLEYNRKQALLDTATTSRGAAVIQTLLDANPDAMAAMCLAPSSKRNHISLSAKAATYMDRYLAGKGVESSDYAKPGEDQGVSAMDQQMRTEGAELGKKQPFSYLTHTVNARGTLFFMLKVVTGTKAYYPSGLKLDLPLNPTIWPGPQGDFPGIDEPFETAMPFKYSQGMTLNGLGAAAIGLKCNYAAWFTAYPMAHGERQSMRECLQKNVKTYVEDGDRVLVRRDEDWLKVLDNADPWPEYGIDWRPFDRFRDVVEGPPLSQKELSARVEALDEKSIAALEDVIPEYSDINMSYYGITGGIRLLRALLIDGGSLTAYDKSIREMSKTASREAMKFFEGSYVWHYCTSLMHPDNLPQLLKARLKASVADGILRFELVLPKAFFTIEKQTEFVFSVPIRP